MALDRALVDRVSNLAGAMEDEVIAYRRDLHKYAESAWLEFRTASLIARRLTQLGYGVRVGKEVVRSQDRMGLPPETTLQECWQRAAEQGGDPDYLQALKGGFTGVVGVLANGKGPTVGLRFDIDALELDESQEPVHRPVREGFASVNAGAAHACGHDGHAAVGLGVAQVLMALKEGIHGTVKLIFQPAEEGVRGAKSMVAAGVVDDVEYLVGHHLFSGWELGQVAGTVGGYLATSKFDATLTGAPAHAASSPQTGRNALLAAATAVLNLYAIPRHREGATRINVGRLHAGTGRNVICSTAHLAIETRGETAELNDYMYESALRVLRAAAAMYECALQVETMGSAQSAEGDLELAKHVEQVATEIGGFTLRPAERAGGSEDFTYMMRRVQEQGGLATNIGIGANLGGWGHHTAAFDLDERALKGAIVLLSSLVLDLVQEGQPLRKSGHHLPIGGREG